MELYREKQAGKPALLKTGPSPNCWLFGGFWADMQFTPFLSLIFPIFAGFPKLRQFVIIVAFCLLFPHYPNFPA